MATFVKLANNSEYQISDDGRYLMYRHVPSGADHWVNQCVIPNGLKVLDMRSSRSGVNVELLLSDNRWYQISSSHGGLTLTTEELEKQRKAKKAANKAKKQEKKSADHTSKRGFLSQYDEPTEDDNCDEDIDPEDEDDDLEEGSDIEDDADNDEYVDSTEAPDVDEKLLGHNYDSLSHLEKAKKIISLYQSSRISEAQAVNELEWIIGITSYDVDDFVKDIKRAGASCSSLELSQKFCSQFKEIIDKGKHDESVFPDLKCIFKDEAERNDLFESSGFFDFATKNKNKKIEKLKDKRTEARREINYNSGRIRDRFISLMDKLSELVSHEQKLHELEAKPIKSDGFLSAMKEKKDLKEQKKREQVEINNCKERIISLNKDIKEYLTSVRKSGEEYNSSNKELLELTKADYYNESFAPNGYSFAIADQLAKNVKNTDSAYLLELFRGYIHKPSK